MSRGMPTAISCAALHRALLVERPRCCKLFPCPISPVRAGKGEDMSVRPCLDMSFAVTAALEDQGNPLLTVWVLLKLQNHPTSAGRVTWVANAVSLLHQSQKQKELRPRCARTSWKAHAGRAGFTPQGGLAAGMAPSPGSAPQRAEPSFAAQAGCPN